MDPLPRLRPVGQNAVLIEASSAAEVAALTQMLRTAGDDLLGITDIIAAARTVLVSFESERHLRALVHFLRHADLPTVLSSSGRRLTLNAKYDGDDLAPLAAHLGMSVQALITWHSGQQWTAAFAGFSPGFMYLSPQEPRLIPRLSTPRTQVPAGSVALGGEFSAVYPTASPGGWQLIARVGEKLWDSTRAEPSLVRVGDSLHFNVVHDLDDGREIIELRSSNPTLPAQTATDTTAHLTNPAATQELPVALEVTNPGPLTMFEDLGRPSFGSLGVTASGALDRSSLRRANRLVGNASHAAALETVMWGLRVRAVIDVVLAVSGGAPGLRVHHANAMEVEAAMDAPIMLRAGQELELIPGKPPLIGFRSYIAVRGGFAGPSVLGSKSRDTLASLGEAPLQRGSALFLAKDTVGAVSAPETSPAHSPQRDVVFRYTPGPRNDWFTDESQERLATETWKVTAQSNRVGLRLEGTALERSRTAPAELPSEGTLKGAIQVPASGMPVLFLADHPVTGGYPVVGVVVAEDLDQAAQLAPGALLRFVPVDSSELPGPASF